jgi:hypothetical protein
MKIVQWEMLVDVVTLRWMERAVWMAVVMLTEMVQVIWMDVETLRWMETVRVGGWLP